MLSEKGSVAEKFKSVVDAKKSLVRTVGMEVARAFQDATRVIRIMIFLHSAQDFPSILRLYGLEDS
jgi:hypothetical protein